MTKINQSLPIPLPVAFGGTGGTTGIPAGANPTATASQTAVNGTATTFMRSDAAPAIQEASASVFGVVKVDGTSITASAGVISAPNTVTATSPTTQVLTSGTAATYTTPAGVKWIEVYMIGGGGGGGGSSTSASNPGAGGVGGDTIFNSIHAAGGLVCTSNVDPGGAGGSGGSGTATFRLSGEPGYSYSTVIFSGGVSEAYVGGSGGGPGGGRGGLFNGGTGTAGTAGVANTGGGGGSATSPTSGIGGNFGALSGGGHGEYVSLIIGSPAGTYTYTIGAAGSAGAAGTNGFVGGAGGSGVIRVTEHYNY